MSPQTQGLQTDWLARFESGVADVASAYGAASGATINLYGAQTLVYLMIAYYGLGAIWLLGKLKGRG